MKSKGLFLILSLTLGLLLFAFGFATGRGQAPAQPTPTPTATMTVLESIGNGIQTAAENIQETATAKGREVVMQAAFEQTVVRYEYPRVPVWLMACAPCLALLAIGLAINVFLFRAMPKGRR